MQIWPGAVSFLFSADSKELLSRMTQKKKGRREAAKEVLMVSRPEMTSFQTAWNLTVTLVCWPAVVTWP